VVSLRHERIEVGPLARLVLPLLDGSRDAEAIAAAVVEAARRGDIVLDRASVDSDEKLPATIARDNLNALLATFARAALLLA
jgi:methyltransferase-like protein